MGRKVGTTGSNFRRDIEITKRLDRGESIKGIALVYNRSVRAIKKTYLTTKGIPYDIAGIQRQIALGKKEKGKKKFYVHYTNMEIDYSKLEPFERTNEDIEWDSRWENFGMIVIE